MNLLELISESRSDQEIHNIPKLDRILVDLCQLVIAGQRADSHRWGMVAAAVLDPKNRMTRGVNYYDVRTDDRVHAERAALDAYLEKYGIEPPHGSIIVTTLSPCSVSSMSGRYGQSCTDLINQSGVLKVYAGYQDPTQSETQKHFNIKVSQNQKIQKMCKTFADTFLDHDLRTVEGGCCPG